MKNRVWALFGLFALGMGAGVLSHFARMTPLYAAEPVSKVVRAESFLLVDQAGKRIAELTTAAEGAPTLFFFDTRGNARLSLGLYADGQPYVVLANEKYEAKAILRLAGNNSPVLVMKNNGQDKLIMGLDMAQSEKPFLVRFDEKGNKETLFGQWG